LIKVTLDPTLLVVSIGLSRFAAMKKSSALTTFGSLHTNPLTSTAQRIDIHTYGQKEFLADEVKTEFQKQNTCRITSMFY
jgi:UDP-glucose 4-epimerase